MVHFWRDEKVDIVVVLLLGIAGNHWRRGEDIYLGERGLFLRLLCATLLCDHRGRGRRIVGWQRGHILFCVRRCIRRL